MTTDIFQLKSYTKKETDIISEILDMLYRHPCVVWAGRFNSGGAKFGNQYVQFNRIESKHYIPRIEYKKRKQKDGTIKLISNTSRMKCPDIIGQLANGKILLIEVKRLGGKRDQDQEAMMEIARKGGAVAVTLEGADEVFYLLKNQNKLNAQD